MTRLRVRNQRGSSLMLMPAAVLVMLFLAAIAIDAAAIRMQARELRNAAQSAANDAVAAAIDIDRLRSDGVLVLDGDAADQIVRDAFAARGITGVTIEAVRIGTEDDDTQTVTVVARREAVHPLTPPGTPETATVRVQVTARQYVD